MDVESLAKELILKNMTPEQQMVVLDSVRKSIVQAKEVQKKKIGENVDLVVQALKKIESDIRDRFDTVGNTIEKRVSSIKDGRDGANGKDGRDGKDGKSGRDGLKGDRGADGQAGRDGVDGVDGISVVNANIDFDGSLIISLSDGREINVGEVVSQDVAEKIKVISTMSTNAAIAIKDEGTSITSSVKNINFVGATVTATNSGDDVTVTVSGGGGSGTVTSVAALTLGTSGTDLSSTVATSTTTPVITLNVPTASATNRGALSSADWTTFNNKGSGTVTSVTGTSPVVSSGGATPAISLASGYGDTLNPYASKTANFVLAAPNGSAGAPTFRAIVAADIPTLNQNTSGTAAGLSATLVATSGGTGQSSYAVGDLLYASTTTALSKLADVATGNALISGGVGVAPSWGKIGLTTHISGTLPVANGGTNASSAGITAFNNITGYSASGATGTTSTNLVFSTSPTLTTPIATTTIGVGAATPSASGAGITFPATQSASSDANTLDDYEEGTWTPGVSFGGGTTGITYHADNGGRYTRVGSLVTLTGYLRLSNKGSSTGTARITGLPFMPTGAGETGNFANAMGYTVAITYSGTLAFYASAGATSLFAISNSSGATSTVLTDTAFANTSQTVISLSYLAT